MAHNIWFEVGLDCTALGGRADAKPRLHVPALNPEVRDVWVVPGDVLAVDLDDFDDAFHRLRTPRGNEVTALEQWDCPGSRVGWVRLRFRREPVGYRFLWAEPSALSRSVLGDVDFLSRRIDLWVEANPEATRDVLDLVEPFLPPPRGE